MSFNNGTGKRRRQILLCRGNCTDDKCDSAGRGNGRLVCRSYRRDSSGNWNINICSIGSGDISCRGQEYYIRVQEQYENSDNNNDECTSDANDNRSIISMCRVNRNYILDRGRHDRLQLDGISRRDDHSRNRYEYSYSHLDYIRSTDDQC